PLSSTMSMRARPASRTKHTGPMRAAIDSARAPGDSTEAPAIPGRYLWTLPALSCHVPRYWRNEMVLEVAKELVRVVETAAPELKALDESQVRANTQPERWSIQEILGHLIDSASNNHHKFVRALEGDVL